MLARVCVVIFNALGLQRIPPFGAHGGDAGRRAASATQAKLVASRLPASPPWLASALNQGYETTASSRPIAVITSQEGSDGNRPKAVADHRLMNSEPPVDEAATPG